MELITCPKGHFYDGSRYSTCPTCEAQNQAAGGNETGAPDISGAAIPPIDDIGKTEPAGSGVTPSADSIGKTEPVPSGNYNGGIGDVDDYGATIAAGAMGGGFTVGGTSAPDRGFTVGGETMNAQGNINGVDNYNDETVAKNPGASIGFAPVVGWLVCIDGPDRGHDYRIHTGYNNIGRSENMDICIRGDKLISRNKHALLAYDDLEKIFFINHYEGRNTDRVNGKMIMGPTQINAYDIITMGSSKFIFIPLCGEKFDWNMSL